ncbi:capsule assembly Wzi family protein [Marinobacter adhaerens]|uniref:Capsule assembly Wzi family protein n=1 Tax=Marinobacter adhaerens TaxID=1033846 RepID=A0A851HQZ5_9GAMM|nr:capsule assembly Wzi family protein [Marinobacter adhaerens]NWN91377.1 capsule assembly Wzi family protein [Marinobacter adhaerens]
MSLKHCALVGGAVACLNALSAVAAPWAEPGDPRARFAIQKLADRGHIERSVTTWPISWADATAGAGSAGRDQQAVGTAAAYLNFEKDQQASPGFRGEFNIRGQNEVPGITGFTQTGTGKAETSLSLQWQGSAWAMGLNPTYTNEPDDDEELRLDGSYLAFNPGNWVFGAGAIDRWWGPGWQSSLILSNNARPMPSVWLTRNSTAAPQNDWLNWIGPWQFTTFVGQYESDREVPDARYVGMRFAFQPIRNLDIGLSRAIMYGGEGRPDGLSTFWDAFIGRDNGQKGEDDPGNQLGSIDIRYGFAVGHQSMGLYIQMMGEDEAGAFPARKSWLMGADWTTQLFAADQQWFLEYTNTTADDLMGNAMPGITYEHSRYQTGYRYYGRNQATSLDGDAEAITLGAHHFLNSGSNLSARITYAELNRFNRLRPRGTDPDVFYNVPAANQTVAIAKVGYGTEILNGWLDLSVQASDKKIEYTSGEKDQYSASASWTYRF